MKLLYLSSGTLVLVCHLLCHCSDACDFTDFPDINFSGNDLPGQPVATNLSTADECAALCCAIAPVCVAFTLNAGSPGSRMCFLKSSSIVHSANPGAESGAAPTPTPPPPPSCALMNGTACAPAVSCVCNNRPSHNVDCPTPVFCAALARGLVPARFVDVLSQQPSRLFHAPRRPALGPCARQLDKRHEHLADTRPLQLDVRGGHA